MQTGTGKNNMMIRPTTTGSVLWLATRALAALMLAGIALGAAAEEGIHIDKAPINERNALSLQRGARLFANYCLSCHSAKYMRYNRLQDIGLTDKEITDNLIFTNAKVGDTMDVAMDPKEAAEWFGKAPPDLSVIARSLSEGHNGADFLYTYLRSFYRDPKRPTGWNNLAYPNVAMPNVLWQLQGTQVLKTEEVNGAEGKHEVHKLVLAKPGTLTPAQYDRAVADLVNYLVYQSEPVRVERQTIGIYVLIFLAIFTLLAYLLKREYWKDVH
jgi:ubiquinol-cytochrome c reductase cytochrome c1 subunit